MRRLTKLMYSGLSEKTGDLEPTLVYYMPSIVFVAMHFDSLSMVVPKGAYNVMM